MGSVLRSLGTAISIPLQLGVVYHRLDIALENRRLCASGYSEPPEFSLLV